MNDGNEWNYPVAYAIERFFGNDPLTNRGSRWESRDVHARNRREFRKAFDLPFAFRGPQAFADLNNGFLGISYEERVQDFGERFGIVHARPSGYEYRVFVFAIVRKRRQVCQFYEPDDSWVREFVLQGEAYRVEIINGGEGLQAVKWDHPVVYLPLHIHPR